MSIHVIEVCALRLAHKRGERPRPLCHPVHGTPPSSDLRARSNNALDLGRSSTKRFCSRCMRDCRRLRSIVFMKGAEILAEIVEAGRPRPAVYGCPAVKGISHSGNSIADCLAVTSLGAGL